VSFKVVACFIRGHRWRRVRRTGTHALVCLRCNQLSTIEAQGPEGRSYAYTDEVDPQSGPYPPG
jgi:hypothetical protein